MDKRRPKGKTVAAILLIVIGPLMAYFVITMLFLKRLPAYNPNEVAEALKQFRAQHQPLPASVTFSQLIAQGYMASNILQRFGASEVTVNLNPSNAYPQAFLMDALMPDGTHNVALADGSVQGFTKSKYQDARRHVGLSPPLTNSSEGSP